MDEKECLRKRNSYFFLSKSVGKGMNGIVYEVCKDENLRENCNSVLKVTQEDENFTR